MATKLSNPLSMYTFTIIDKVFNNGVLTVAVDFTNGTDTFIQTFNASSAQDEDWLKKAINSKMQELQSISRFHKKLKKGEYDTTIAPLPERIAPTPTAQDTWKDEVAKLRKLKSAVEIGVIQEADLEAQQDKVKDTFSISFIDSL